jgi:hypothetical protein
MNQSNPNELLFSRKPRISVPDVRGWLARQQQGDETVKAPLIKFIDHRLRGRYIAPLQHVTPEKYRSGFLMMASACLLIESLQTFYDGKNESKDPNTDPNDTEVGSEAAFVRFFEKHGKFFPGLRGSFPLVSVNRQGKTFRKCAFYKHIRCGILHQAETTGRFSVVRDETPLFDPMDQTVNADEFLNAVEACLDKYINDLGSSAITSKLWNGAAAKLNHICENFE